MSQNGRKTAIITVTADVNYETELRLKAMAYHMPFNLSSLNGTFDFATWLKHSNISFSDLSVLPEISTREKVLKISTYVLAMMLSLGFNSLIIVVIAKTKSLRTKFNFYVINLACVNILIVLTCMWLHLVTNLNPSKWPLGSFFCKIHTFMQGKIFG